MSTFIIILFIVLILLCAFSVKDEKERTEFIGGIEPDDMFYIPNPVEDEYIRMISTTEGGWTCETYYDFGGAIRKKGLTMYTYDDLIDGVFYNHWIYLGRYDRTKSDRDNFSTDIANGKVW